MSSFNRGGGRGGGGVSVGVGGGVIDRLRKGMGVTVINSLKKDCGQAQYRRYSILNTATFLCLL